MKPMAMIGSGQPMLRRVASSSATNRMRAHHHVQRAAGCRRGTPGRRRSRGCRAPLAAHASGQQPVAPAACRPATARLWRAGVRAGACALRRTPGRSAPARRPGARRGGWSRAAGRSRRCSSGSSDSAISSHLTICVAGGTVAGGTASRGRTSPRVPAASCRQAGRGSWWVRQVNRWRTLAKQNGRIGPPVLQSEQQAGLLQQAGFLVELLGTRMERDADALDRVLLA